MRWKCWAIGYLKTICNVVLWRSNHEIVQFAIAGVVGRERNCAFGTILSIWLVNEVCGTTIKSLNSHIRVLYTLFGMTSFDIGVMSPQFYNAFAFKHILHLSSFLTKLRNQNPYMLLSPTRSRQYITKKFLLGIEINLNRLSRAEIFKTGRRNGTNLII